MTNKLLYIVCIFIVISTIGMYPPSKVYSNKTNNLKTDSLFLIIKPDSSIKYKVDSISRIIQNKNVILQKQQNYIIKKIKQNNVKLFIEKQKDSYYDSIEYNTPIVYNNDY